MSTLQTTNHAIERLAQRGIAMSDIDLILEIGSEVEGGFLVRQKDLDAIERDLKRFMDRVRRLEGKRLVVKEGCLVTAYHSHGKDERRLLRSLTTSDAQCHRSLRPKK